MISGEMDDGTLSMAGTILWLTMIESAPASIPALKGENHWHANLLNFGCHRPNPYANQHCPHNLGNASGSKRIVPLSTM